MNQVQKIAVDKFNGNFVLTKDGIQAACSEKQPIITMGQMGHPEIINLPCSTACPFASLVEVDGTFQYVVKCRHQQEIFIVEMQEEKQSTTPLIQM